MFEQSVKADGGKVRPTLVPPEIITAIATIREFGMKKYKDRNNWKMVEEERYWDALARHFIACWEDHDNKDEESGLPSIWHMACNIAFIIALQEKKKKEREDVPYGY